MHKVANLPSLAYTWISISFFYRDSATHLNVDIAIGPVLRDTLELQHLRRYRQKSEISTMYSCLTSKHLQQKAERFYNLAMEQP